MIRRRDDWLQYLLAGAVVAQGAGVVYLGRLADGEAVQVGVASLALAMLVAQAWRHRMQLNHRVDMLLVMGALGGLDPLCRAREIRLAALDFDPPGREPLDGGWNGGHRARDRSGVAPQHWFEHPRRPPGDARWDVGWHRGRDDLG